MKIDPNFSREFLTELNRRMTSDSWSRHVYDLTTPIRNLFLESKDLLTFSLARYAGGSVKIAFACQWYFQTLEVLQNPQALIEENLKYFKKKIPLRLRGVPGLDKKVTSHIKDFILPQQNIILFSRLKEFLNELVEEFPYFSKYFSDDLLAKIQFSQLMEIKPLYQEVVTQSQYLDSQSTRNSFVKVSLPCLLGLLFTFNNGPLKIESKNIKQVLLEEIFKSIAALHQTAISKDFQMFIYASRLSEKEEFLWWQMDLNKQLQLAIASSEAREICKSLREKIYQNATNNLSSVGLNERHKNMVYDLLQWAFSMS